MEIVVNGKSVKKLDKGTSKRKATDFAELLAETQYKGMTVELFDGKKCIATFRIQTGVTNTFRGNVNGTMIQAGNINGDIILP